MIGVWCRTVGPSCVVLISLLGATAAEPVPPGSSYRSITAARLIGATLDEVGSNAPVVWHFGVKRFRVDFRGEPPADLVRQLLGRTANVARIEGQWRYEDDRGYLVLHDLAAKGVKNAREVSLPISPAGLLRADLGGRQYQLLECYLGGRWESVGGGPKVVWKFDERQMDRYAILVETDKGPLPERLVAKLLGRPTASSRITGEGEVDSHQRRLVLKNLRAGNQQQSEPIEIAVKVVDVLVIELLGDQYRRLE